jgi:hypothetical protein
LLVCCEKKHYWMVADSTDPAKWMRLIASQVWRPNSPPQLLGGATARWLTSAGTKQPIWLYTLAAGDRSQYFSTLDVARSFFFHVIGVLLDIFLIVVCYDFLRWLRVVCKSWELYMHGGGWERRSILLSLNKRMPLHFLEGMAT